MHTIYILIAVNRSQVNKNTINVPLWLRKRDIHLPRLWWANIISLAVSVINGAGLRSSLVYRAGTEWPWSLLLVIVCRGHSFSKVWTALSQVPRMIPAHVITPDTKSIYTQFVFSQIQVHINRATGDTCEVDHFSWISPASLFATLSNLRLSTLFFYKYNVPSNFSKFCHT